MGTAHLLIECPQPKLQVRQQEAHREVLQHSGYGLQVCMAQRRTQSLHIRLMLVLQQKQLIEHAAI